MITNEREQLKDKTKVTRGVFRGGPNRRAPPLNTAIIVVSTCVLRSSKSTKINSGRGFAPEGGS